MAQKDDALTAARRSIAFADDRFENSMCGLLTIDPAGNVGAWHSTPKMAIGIIGQDGDPRAAMSAGELFG
jgi:isoaspartyl peptidase/L-asparaginase-like protein (Ntn-hydrolase superfamily)